MPQLKVLPDIQEKVAFLSSLDAYSGDTRHVETKQTHMSWVFLTDAHAWKLKKPVRHDCLDFTTPEARRRNCEEEVRLNRRLAPSVYLGVVPLTVDAVGQLALGGQGQPVDWLVQMRRLPADRMLDRAIANRTWTDEDLRRVGVLLATFYKQSSSVPMTGEEYRTELGRNLVDAQIELSRSEYGLSRDSIQSTVGLDLIRLGRDAELFDERTHAGKVVEAHGDLRPEHICLGSEPLIIDCLEFNRVLRLLDPASEISFLALECERLGAPQVGEIILDSYCGEAGDRPAIRLLEFYRSYHACIRAKIAVWHLRDPDTNAKADWVARASQYLQLARGRPAVR